MRFYMKCDEVRGALPDLAAGFMEPSSAVQEHLQACASCATQLQEFQKTMALLDEWKAPEPSGYFDTRLKARLREEKTAEAERGRRGWLAWLPRPALAMATALLLAAGVGLVRMHNSSASGSRNIAVVTPVTGDGGASAQRGTAVGDLETLDSDDDLYANFDVLDDIDSQQNQPTTSN